MNYFVTREVARTFIGQGTENSVAFNPLVDKFVLLKDCSSEDVIKVIREYEAIRLKVYCLSLLTKVEDTTFLKAFRFDCHSAVVLNIKPLVKQFKIALPYHKNLQSKFAAMSYKAQKKFIVDRIPTSFEDAGSLLSAKGIEYSLHSNFMEFLQRSSSVMDFMNILATLAVTSHTGNVTNIKLEFAQGSREFNAKWLIPRAKELLTLMHAKGLVLFPLMLRRTVKGIKSASSDPYACRSQMATLSNCINCVGYEDRGCKPGTILARVDMLLHASTVKEVGDLSKDFLQAYDEVMRERRIQLEDITDQSQKASEAENEGPSNPTGRLTPFQWRDGEATTLLQYRNVIKTLTALYEYTYPNAPLTYLPIYEARHEHPGKLSDTKWMVERNPSFEKWAEVIDAFLNRKRAVEVKSDHTERQRLNKFIDYLLTLKGPPLCPEQIIRERHIYDEKGVARTYWQSLNDDMSFKIYSKNRYLKTAHELFYWYEKKLQKEKVSGWDEFINPIDWEIDRWRGDENPYETHRPALSSQIVELMKRIILENDYAFCRDRERSAADYVWVYDRDLKQRAEVWYPGRAVLLIVMLYLLTRSFQARWMDSGEGDEFIVKITIDSETKQMVLEMIKNEDARATPKRQAGAFRIDFTTLDEPLLATYLSTNKTGDYTAQGKNMGHIIPWCPDEVRDALMMMREWQRRYGMYVAKPVEAIDLGHRDKRKQKRDYAHKIEVYPLFRDPTRIDADLPVSRQRLERFYFEVLYAAQEIITTHNPQLKPFIRREIKTKAETSRYRKGVYETKDEIVYVTDHDLHGLRVTGITNLMIAGVPIEFISKAMAGHRTIFMTLYYGKFDPRTIRESLEKANEIARSRASEGHKEEWLLSRRDGDTFKPLTQITRIADGTWKHQLDGYCPGTRCEEGGPLIGKNKTTPSPVPQSRCPLCRFWITGPRFLSGLDIEMNRIFHQIHRGEQKIKALNEDITRLEIKRDKGDASVQGLINVLYGELNKLQETRSYDLQEMAARKLWMDTITKMLETGQDHALITGNDEQGLKVVIQQGHYIHLLHRQSLATEIVVGFRNDQAVMELKGMLETMLALNGRISPLLRLNPEVQLRSVNLLADYLVQVVPDDDEMQRLLSGESTLEQIYLPDNTTLDQKIDLICQSISDGTALSKVDMLQALSVPNNSHPSSREMA